jgi:hypothetical protein
MGRKGHAAEQSSWGLSIGDGAAPDHVEREPHDQQRHGQSVLLDKQHGEPGDDQATETCSIDRSGGKSPKQ